MSVFRFAFIIHPLSIDDVYGKFRFMRGLPRSWSEKLIRSIPPLKISRIEGRSSKGDIEGYFIYLGLTSEQFYRLPPGYCMQKILKCGRLAEKSGVQLLGLGGLSSLAGGRGVEIARHLNSAVTTGGTYRLAAALESSEKAVELSGKKKDNVRCLILGAVTSMENACAQLLISKGFIYLTLISSGDKHRANRLADKLLYEYGVSVKITSNINKALAEADLIFFTGSIKEFNFTGANIKPGAIICNLNRNKESMKEVFLCRPDVVYIENWIIQVPPQISFKFNSGYPPQTTTAEVAETIILSMERRKHNYSLGEDIRAEKVEEITEMARKHGFKLGGYHSKGRIVSLN